MSALAKINIGVKQLGIGEDDKRDFYQRLTGERSLRAMRPDQHKAILDELARMGFKPASKGSRKRLEGKYAGKLQALWIAGYNLGLIRNRDDAALLTFVKRQAKVDHTRFLRYPGDAASAIEALKKWLERDGGVDWKQSRFLPDWSQTNGYRIATAQHQKLIFQRLILPEHSLVDVLRTHGFEAPWSLSDKDWIDAMNKLGALIRAAKADGKRGVA